MTLTDIANRAALAAEDSYSRDRYADVAWRKIAKALIVAGASEAEATWILKSKHMRWAADQANKRTGCTALDFSNYAAKQKRVVGDGLAGLIEKARRELGTVDTRTGFILNGAELAGACEGEQIAEALDIILAALNQGAFDKVRANRLIEEIKARR